MVACTGPRLGLSNSFDIERRMRSIRTVVLLAGTSGVLAVTSVFSDPVSSVPPTDADNQVIRGLA